MLTNDRCPYCVKARHLIKNNLKVQNPYMFNLDQISQDDYQKYAPCFAENSSIMVPKIFYKGNFIGGYSELS